MGTPTLYLFVSPCADFVHRRPVPDCADWLARDGALFDDARMNVPGLRSPYEKVGGIFYFGRMLDKIRLHAAGKLPEDFQANLGKGFDGRITRFLQVDYNALVDRVKQGGSDEEILQWCFENGRKWTNDEELETWNTFMRKVGWKDDVTPTLQRRLKEGGFEDRTDIQTIFDYMDLDEGRDPRQRSVA